MIAVGWRQFRGQAVVAAAGLVAVAIVLAITGPHLVHVSEAALASCRAQGVPATQCPNPVTGTFKDLRVAIEAIVLVGPGLIGLFWGAPLIARELETGSFRLAWTQSVTRRRWLLSKIVLVGMASAAAAELVTVMWDWWSSPIQTATQDRFDPIIFSVTGIAPLGYAAFAFALGAAAGVTIRRTLPAMGVTLGGFVGARVLMTLVVRPHLATAKTLTTSLLQSSGFGYILGASGPQVVAAPGPMPGNWVLSAAIVNNAGASPTTATLLEYCPNLPGLNGNTPGVPPKGGPGQGAFAQCVRALNAHFHQVVYYQPGNRYWLFQTFETLIFLGAAVALGALCLWWVRHRLR